MFYFLFQNLATDAIATGVDRRGSLQRQEKMKMNNDWKVGFDEQVVAIRFGHDDKIPSAVAIPPR